MKKISLGLSFVLSTLLYQSSLPTAAAGLKAPDFAVVAQRQGPSWLISASPPAAHHFNTDAPMALTVINSKEGESQLKPKKADLKKVLFVVPFKTDHESFKISLYLCDDSKTFCEKHVVDFSTHGKEEVIAPSALPLTGPEVVPAAKKAVRSHGFLVNAPDEALAQAKLEDKPIIIDFFGIWCPPCNELDEKVFSSKEFAQSSSRFVRLKLDADEPLSWKLKSKYQVGGYPTVIFTSAEGDEISRVVGFRDKTEFLKAVHLAWENRTSTLSRLEMTAAQGDRDSADRAGVIRLERGEGEAAVRLLTGTQKKREFLHLAEILALEDKDASADQKITKLNAALIEFPKTPNTIDWLEKLSKLYAEKKDEKQSKVFLKQAIDLSHELAMSLELLLAYDSTPADILENEASLREELDGKALARADWLMAAKAYSERGVGPKERANNLEMAFCLGKGGELEEARSIYRRLQKFYPNDFTFYFAHARMEFEVKNLGPAISLAKKAENFAYGDNRLRVTLLLAQALDADGKKTESRKLIDDTLKDAALPADSKIRTHRYAQALTKFRKTL